MNISETPDKWVVLKIDDNDLNKSLYKVFGSWAGGYLDGDRWKLNSGITDIKEDDDYYYFIGASGSCYKCHKQQHGIMTSYSQHILDRLINNPGLSEMTNINIIIVDKDTDYINLLK